ncbi:DUF6205 family protein [Micromonospora carbonacea]|uniref:DUF6205 family protein n=1 Tax=Micromonospora carbonacea TaxID=47853 RepID=UPI003710E8B7
MGYITRFTGEIAITPPIHWGDIKDSPFLPDNARNRDGRDVMFRIAEAERDTLEGTLIARSAVALAPTWEDEMRGYDIVEHVQQVVDAHPGHEFTGRLDCEGEEAGDLWRLEVHDRRAVKVTPRIVWPDGSEVKPRL